MPQRRKFELLLADLWRIIADPKRVKRDSALSLAVWNVRAFSLSLMRDPTKTRQVVEFAGALRSSDAPGRQVAEEELMRELASLAWKCSQTLEIAELTRRAKGRAAQGAALEFQPVLQVLQVLHDYALGCFQFTRPRDAFGGRRRGCAFSILTFVGRVVELPHVVRLVEQAANKDSAEGWQANQFLDDYFAEDDDEPEV